MKMKTPAGDRRPFLSYSDDPVRSAADVEETSSPFAHESVPSKQKCHRLARDLLVFLLASLLWLAAIFLFLPRPTLSPSSSSSSPTTAAATTGSEKQKGAAMSGGVGGGDFRTHNITSDARWVSCGNSPAEAQGKGCRYDALLNHWVPAPCVDQEWIDEYQDDDSWAAFAEYVPPPPTIPPLQTPRENAFWIALLFASLTWERDSVNLTQRLSPEDMGRRDHYYTSIRDHINHCAVLWRKQFWTLFEERRVFDGVIVNTYHTEHCASFLSDLVTMNRTEPTLVRVGFSGCWVRESREEL